MAFKQVGEAAPLKDMSGKAWVNRKKTERTHADVTGSVKINDQDMYWNLWINLPRDTPEEDVARVRKFLKWLAENRCTFSSTFKPKMAQQRERETYARHANEEPDEFNDEVPF